MCERDATRILLLVTGFEVGSFLRKPDLRAPVATCSAERQISWQYILPPSDSSVVAMMAEYDRSVSGSGGGTIDQIMFSRQKYFYTSGKTDAALLVRSSPILPNRFKAQTMPLLTAAQRSSSRRLLPGLLLLCLSLRESSSEVITSIIDPASGKQCGPFFKTARVIE